MGRLVILSALLAVAGCAGIPLETVSVPAQSDGWKMGYGNERRGRTILELIPTNESISSWSRMLTIQFLEGMRQPPRAVMTSLEAEMRSRCPNALWNVIAEDATSITYQWSISNCGGQPDQIELARLLKGNDGVHRVAYVRKGTAFDPSERETWLTALSNAYVTKDGKRVVVAPDPS